MDEFCVISKHKKWINKQQVTALEYFIKDSSISQLAEEANIESIKKELRKGVKDKTNSSLIQLRIYKTRQVNFRYINEYAEAIKKLVDDYSKKEHLTKNEYGRKIKENFM